MLTSKHGFTFLIVLGHKFMVWPKLCGDFEERNMGLALCLQEYGVSRMLTIQLKN